MAKEFFCKMQEVNASKYEQVSKLSNRQFKRYIGVSRKIFEILVLLVSQAEKKRKKKAGRKAKLSLEEQILMSLSYYRQYRTFFHLATDYGLSESNCQRTVVKIENILIQSGYFNLPGKKLLLSNKEIEAILTDVTETAVQRPKKWVKKRKLKRSSKQRRYYSGNKKRHTLKTQVVVNAQTMKIICLQFGKGSSHDFTIYKNSKLLINKHIKQKTDLGYLGIKRLHTNTELPDKSSKKHKLTKEQKKQNRRLAKERVGNEHVIGKLKISRILFGP